MTRIAILGLVLAAWLPSLSAQTIAPPEVVKSAVTAVEALGDKVVKGQHMAAIDSMYPKWKARMAKRKGGMRKVEDELRGIGEMMARNGVSIISFKAVGAPKTYEIEPGPSSKAAAGETNFTKWLMLIPTVIKFRILVSEDPRPEFEVIDSVGFQVAIADKGKNNWTFINGSDVSVADLRSMFITLPANMKLPQVKRQVAD